MLRAMGITTKIVIISAHPLNVQQRLLQGQKVDLLLTKPFTLESMAAALGGLFPEKAIYSARDLYDKSASAAADPSVVDPQDLSESTHRDIAKLVATMKSKNAPSQA